MEIEETDTESQRTVILVRLLQEKFQLDSLKFVDQNKLTTTDSKNGIHNTGIVATTRGMNLQYNKHLIPELKKLVQNPELIQRGPAGILLGFEIPPNPDTTKPHPTIAFSSLHQDEAIHSAMTNPFTVVSGPPGTGKSQVLLNVVAASIAKKQSVLLASKNNQSVDVVCERLKSCSPETKVLRVGSHSNISSKDILRINPPSESTTTVYERWNQLERTLRKIYEELTQRVQIERSRTSLQFQHIELHSNLPTNVKIDVDPKSLNQAIDIAEYELERVSKPLRWFFKRRRFQKRQVRARVALDRVKDQLYVNGRGMEDCYKLLDSTTSSLSRLKTLFQDTIEVSRRVMKSVEISSQLTMLEQKLDQLSTESELEDKQYELNPERAKIGHDLVVLQRHHSISQMATNVRVAVDRIISILTNYSNSGTQNSTLEKHFESALPVLPAWAVTMQSLAANFPFKPQLFDLVVIDEASQCDIASVLPLLVRAKRALIIGDKQQLTHITTIKSSRESLIAKNSKLKKAELEGYSYTRLSCYDLASSRVEKQILLNLHFRSNSSIILFSDSQFYENKLELCSLERPIVGHQAIEWIHVEGCCEQSKSHSRFNKLEAKFLIESLLCELRDFRGMAIDIGIITPYVAQRNLLQKLLEAEAESRTIENIKIGTVHAFQGDERDVIYFSSVIDCVAANATRIEHFFSNHLINVAVTRARKRLVIIGNQKACLRLDSAISDLVNYVLQQDSRFDSPMERKFFDALVAEGIPVKANLPLNSYRLDLAIEHDGIKLDIECDGAAFHTDSKSDFNRDRNIEALGWKVLRFSHRQINRNLKACVDKVIDEMNSY